MPKLRIGGLYIMPSYFEYYRGADLSEESDLEGLGSSDIVIILGRPRGSHPAIRDISEWYTFLSATQGGIYHSRLRDGAQLRRLA